MHRREPFVRKHVHKWEFGGAQWVPDPGLYHLLRECSECSKRMIATVTGDSPALDLPRSMIQFADVEWHDWQQEVPATGP